MFSKAGSCCYSTTFLFILFGTASAVAQVGDDEDAAEVEECAFSVAGQWVTFPAEVCAAEPGAHLELNLAGGVVVIDATSDEDDPSQIALTVTAEALDIAVLLESERWSGRLTGELTARCSGRVTACSTIRVRFQVHELVLAPGVYDMIALATPTRLGVLTADFEVGPDGITLHGLSSTEGDVELEAEPGVLIAFHASSPQNEELELTMTFREEYLEANDLSVVLRILRFCDGNQCTYPIPTRYFTEGSTVHSGHLEPTGFTSCQRALNHLEDCLMDECDLTELDDDECWYEGYVRLPEPDEACVGVALLEAEATRERTCSDVRYLWQPASVCNEAAALVIDCWTSVCTHSPCIDNLPLLRLGVYACPQDREAAAAQILELSCEAIRESSSVWDIWFESAAYGRLSVDASPSAAVYVDDTFVGMTPVRNIVLPVGQHDITVLLGGLETTRPVVVTEAGLHSVFANNW